MGGFVCFNTSSSVFELVSYLNIATYTGYILFAVYNSTLYPLSYPIGQIGVVGGILNRQHQTAIKEWTIIGDSLSQGQGWWTYVQDEIWIPTITNLAVSGMRMAMSSGMWTEKDTVTATTDLCTIMGGTNDEATCYNTDGTSTSVLGSLQPIKGTFDTNTFYGAYQTLIEGLLTKNPNMRIILMTPPRAWKDSTASVLRKNLANIGNDVKAIGAAYNLPVVDMYNQMGYNEVNQSTFLSDGLHFVATGYQRVASLVCNAMRQYSYE